MAPSSPHEIRPEPGRTWFALLVVVALGLVLNLLGFLFPPIIPEGFRRPNVFVISGRTTVATSAQVFFDFGDGIHPDQSWVETLGSAPAAWTELKFGLPVGNLYGLRFDPTNKDVPSSWKDARLEDEQGRVLHRFSPEDFVSGQQVAQLVRENGVVTVVPTSGAFDTTTYLTLRHPVSLPDDSPAGRHLQEQPKMRQRVGALLLALLGAFLAYTVYLRHAAARPSSRTSVRPPSSGVSPLPPPPVRWLELIVLAYAALSITYFRRPSIFVAPQLYVEDGVIFFAQQWANGWKSLLIPYSGYLHLAPRLVAGAASWFPLAWAPRLYGLAGLAFVVAAVLKASSPRVRFPFAYACALAVVLVPNMDEITAFTVNIHWWGAAILLLVGLSAPARSTGELVRDLAVVLIVGFSGPWGLLLTPLLAYRAWTARTAGAALTAAVALAVGLIQYHFQVSYGPLPPGESFWTAHGFPALAGAGYRTGGQLIGYQPLVRGVDVSPWEFAALAGWIALLCFLPLARRHRRLRWSLAGTALIVVAATVLRCRNWEYMLFSPAICQRYFFLPLLITLWLLILALDAEAPWKRAVPLLLLAVVAVRNAGNFRMPPVVDFHWSRYAERIERGEQVDVAIYPAGWGMTVAPRGPK
jgi:hypothetical protein